MPTPAGYKRGNFTYWDTKLLRCLPPLLLNGNFSRKE